MHCSPRDRRPTVVGCANFVLLTLPIWYLALHSAVAMHHSGKETDLAQIEREAPRGSGTHSSIGSASGTSQRNNDDDQFTTRGRSPSRSRPSSRPRSESRSGSRSESRSKSRSGTRSESRSVSRSGSRSNSRSGSSRGRSSERSSQNSRHSRGSSKRRTSGSNGKGASTESAAGHRGDRKHRSRGRNLATNIPKDEKASGSSRHQRRKDHRSSRKSNPVVDKGKGKSATVQSNHGGNASKEAKLAEKHDSTMASLKQLAAKISASGAQAPDQEPRLDFTKFVCKVVGDAEKDSHGNSGKILNGLNEACDAFQRRGLDGVDLAGLCKQMDKCGGKGALMREIDAQIELRVQKQSDKLTQLEAQMLRTLEQKSSAELKPKKSEKTRESSTVGPIAQNLWIHELKPELESATGASCKGAGRRHRRDAQDAVFAVMVVFFFGYMCTAFPQLLPLLVFLVAIIMLRGTGGAVRVWRFQ